METRLWFPALAVSLAALSAHPPLGAAENLADAFVRGDASISFRYRFEYVDQDAFAETAEASTLRGRINFATDPWNGFSAFAEFDFIADIVWDDYNAGAGNTPDRTRYPVVADPTGPDLNQAYLDWTGAEGARLRVGRQRITLDNQRFIGAVGWRQNEQTFDAAFFQSDVGGLDLKLAWLWQVNRVFGRDVPTGQEDHSTPLVHLSYNWEGRGSLSAYFYDIDNRDSAASSSRSAGLRWAGTANWSDRTASYTLEYAHQKDAHDQPVDYSADYYRADLSVGFGSLKPTIGIESLGGDDSRPGRSFQTPLATLHGFNGWVDKFLLTPGAGLNDLFLGLEGGLGAWTWNLVYHDFEPESGGRRYGSELDGSITRKFGEHYGLLFKAARFDGDSGPPYDDVTKLWVEFTADF